MRVADLMSTNVICVRPETPLKDVAAIFAAQGISGVPVVTSEGELVGVVSEADILAKERRPAAHSRFAQLLGHESDHDPKAEARTAGEAMTSPAVTIDAGRRVDVAAGLMLDRGINRLPVVGRDGALLGIVTRADLVRAFIHDDAEILREIHDEVLLHELWLDPTDFSVEVDQGEVTISGSVRHTDEAVLLERRIRLVPGVVSVRVRENAASK
ncbi:MAG TPA: CBS domain-containing protein [Gaiellaceae bacterium]|nr:CBS domain-containing protein [Gaiellaceae bacterium]